MKGLKTSFSLRTEVLTLSVASVCHMPVVGIYMAAKWNFILNICGASLYQ